MKTQEIKGYESVDFPDGMTDEEMFKAINKMIASGELKQSEGVEAEQVEDWKSGDPTAMAQEIVKREGGDTTFEEAYERVVGFPRREKALLEGTSFPIVSTAFDIGSAPARGLMGAVSALGGTDPSERMSQPNVNNGEGFFGTVDDMIQNVITDPLTLVGAGISTPLKAGASQLLPKAGSFLTGAVEGATAGATEYALEQAKRGETGEALQTPLDAGIQIGTGGLVSGAGSKLGDALGPKELSTRQEVRQTQKELDKVASDAIPEGVDAFAWGQVTPMNRVGFNPNTKPEKGEIDYKELLTIGKASAEGVEGAINPLEHTFREVGLPAFKEYDKIRSDVGKELGSIRKDYVAKINPISKQSLIDDMNVNLGEFADYQISRVEMDDGSIVTKLLDKDGDVADDIFISDNVLNVLEKLDKLPDKLTANKLELLRKSIAKDMPKDLLTKQPIYDADDMVIKNMLSDVTTKIDEGIEEIAPEVSDRFRSLRADYKVLRSNKEILGNLIGSTIKGSGGFETTKKGTSALKRVVQSLQDQGSNIVWEDVKKRTGYDVKRASARALESMVVNGDDKARSLLGELGLLNKSVASIQNPISLEGAKKGFEISKEFVKPSALPSLQVEKQGISNTSSLLDAMAPEPYADFRSSFAPYTASGSRSGGRGMFSGSQESNKVTEKPIGGIGAEKIRQGMDQ